MKNLLIYHFKTYLKSYKLLLPFLIYLIYLFAAYGIMPFSIVSSFSESAGVLFFMMAFVGFSYAELENPVTEQMVLLRVNNDILYYLSRLTVLLIIGVVMSILGILYPVIDNVVNKGHLFTRSLLFEDVRHRLFPSLFNGLFRRYDRFFFSSPDYQKPKMAVTCSLFVLLPSWASQRALWPSISPKPALSSKHFSTGF